MSCINSPAVSHSPIASSLSIRFIQLAESVGASSSTASTWSSLMISRYTESQRHYHTLTHVVDMLACLDARRADLTNAVAVELAAFFHDWVYEPQGSANEAESVVEFVKFAEEVGVEQEVKQKVVMMVEATVGHAVGDVVAAERGDVEMFLDFDLEVLGREWREYETYVRQIRDEYKCYSDEDYAAGRIKVLRSFLERDRVYFSEWFYRDKEQTARTNLKREIELLELGRATEL